MIEDDRKWCPPPWSLHNTKYYYFFMQGRTVIGSGQRIMTMEDRSFERRPNGVCWTGLGLDGKRCS